MIQKTSLEAFKTINQNGLLRDSQIKIYRAIVYTPKQTAAEIMSGLGLERNQSGRFTELQNLGCITEGDTRKCNQTGNSAITWISTDKLPAKETIKKPTKVERKSETIQNIHRFMENIYMNSEQVKEYSNIIKLIENI
tara:strand:- start:2003 stop:2416 length:414 start_codon:yes stop_codon:yes gene_type:complete